MIGTIIAKRSVKTGFDAFNNGDLETFLKAWSENGVFIYQGKVRAGGQYTGITEIKRWFEAFIIQFPERRFVIKHMGVENILDMNGNNTVFVQLDIDLVNKDGHEVTNSAVSVINLIKRKNNSSEEFSENFGR
jgi:ketosteroid isomerase-like protein